MIKYIKITAMILALVIVLSGISLIGASAEESGYIQPEKFIYGDVDLDGKVTVKDATLIQKGLAKITYVTAVQRYLADPDGTGYSVKNATAIQKYLAKYETSTHWGEEIIMASPDEFSSKIKINDPKMKNSLVIIPKNYSHSYCIEDFPELDAFKIEKNTYFNGDIDYELFLYADTEAELFEAIKKIDYRANIDLSSVDFCIGIAIVH